MENVFIPLDIPKFEYSDKVAKEFSMNRTYKYWEIEAITEFDGVTPIGSVPNIKNTHPELVEFVKTQFPFDGIVSLELFKCIKDIPYHIDNSYLCGDTRLKDLGEDETHMYITPEFYNHQLNTEPCGYRMMFFGDRQSLYYEINGKKEYVNIPEETDSYVLKTYSGPHACKLTPKDHNRLVLFVVGWVDKAKHYDLLNRSMIKYSEYCI